MHGVRRFVRTSFSVFSRGGTRRLKSSRITGTAPSETPIPSARELARMVEEFKNPKPKVFSLERRHKNVFKDDVATGPEFPLPDEPGRMRIRTRYLTKRKSSRITGTPSQGQPLSKAQLSKMVEMVKKITEQLEQFLKACKEEGDTTIDDVLKRLEELRRNAQG